MALKQIGSDANKKDRLPSSLSEQLIRQTKFLKNSCRLFDEGGEEEAVRIATTIRVLLHDHGNSSVSLLKQLNVKNRLLFEDTGIYRHKLNETYDKWVNENFPGMSVVSDTVEAGLVIFSFINGEPAWIPPLDQKRFFPFGDPSVEPQEFEAWWNTPLVERGSYQEGSFRSFSRKDLVLIMANQDGGAHVSPKLDEDYQYLVVDDLGLSWSTSDNIEAPAEDFVSTKGNVAAASMRQIGYEILKTFEQNGLLISV